MHVQKKTPENTQAPIPSPPVISAPGQKLTEAANFKIGAAISSNRIKAEPANDNVLKSEFNHITAEYEMKMSYILTAESTYNFDNVDYLINYAQQNKMDVHGHALLWYRSFPEWFLIGSHPLHRQPGPEHVRDLFIFQSIPYLV